MNKEDERQFFATKSGEPHRIHMGGKRVSFADFPKDLQKKILEKAKGVLNKLPGLKINGKLVTKDNIHEFEVKPEQVEKEKANYSKEDLDKLSFKKLKKLAKKFGQTGRSKSGLIKDILKSQ